MKKGDLVYREIGVAEGGVLASGFQEESRAKTWLSRDGFRKFDDPAPHCFLIVEREDGWAVVGALDFSYKERARVSWIVGSEVSLELLLGPTSYRLVNLKEETWVVYLESTPSFQSSVAEMSEDELRASIENLRGRKFPVKVKKERKARKALVKTSVKPVPNDPVSKMLSKLTPEERGKILAKMGVDF